MRKLLALSNVIHQRALLKIGSVDVRIIPDIGLVVFSGGRELERD